MDERTDLAVITIPEAATGGRTVEPARFGRIRDGTAALSVNAFGFPLFKLRDDPAHRDLRFELHSFLLDALVATEDRTQPREAWW